MVRTYGLPLAAHAPKSYNYEKSGHLPILCCGPGTLIARGGRVNAGSVLYFVKLARWDRMFRDNSAAVKPLEDKRGTGMVGRRLC